MPRTSAPDTHEAASRLEDMATQRVPEEHTVSGWHIALILVGIVITIPAFLTGAELGLALGVKGISVAIPVGALTLCLIGCLTATVAVQSRLTTYMIIRRAFIGCYSVWDDAADSDRNFEFTRRILADIKPSSVGGYINETDAFRDPERARSAFSNSAWRRLGKLRSKYDPGGLFANFPGV